MESLINFEYNLLEIEIQNLENEIHRLTRKPYKIRNRANPIQTYSENEFRRRFRLSKDSVRYLYSLIGAELEPIVSRENFTISGLDKFLMTLRYYATSSFHLATADFYGVSESSVCNIVPVVSERIAVLRERFIFRVAGMPCIK